MFFSVANACHSGREMMPTYFSIQQEKPLQAYYDNVVMPLLTKRERGKKEGEGGSGTTACQAKNEKGKMEARPNLREIFVLPQKQAREEGEKH